MSCKNRIKIIINTMHTSRTKTSCACHAVVDFFCEVIILLADETRKNYCKQNYKHWSVPLARDRWSYDSEERRYRANYRCNTILGSPTCMITLHQRYTEQTNGIAGRG